MRKLESEKLVLATHNPGKVKEVGALLAPHDINVVMAADLDLPEPEETGKTFEENAVLKAKFAAGAAGLPALADDSGLAVNALNGEPGVYSARWAGPDKDFYRAAGEIMEKLRNHGAEDWSAAFVCVLALAWPDGYTETFEGRIDGTFVWPPRGDKGFGYDPNFVPEGEERTFAEMDPEEKAAVSHRTRAFDKFVNDALKPT